MGHNKNNLLTVLETFKNNNHSIKSVFDIGAHVGMWTQRYEKILTDAAFFMFEANPNKKRPNGISQKHTWINGVLSSEIKSVMFYADGGKKGTGDSYYKEDTLAYDNVEPIELKTNTIDQIIADKNIPKPQLMKLDTQGSEIDIMKGATETLKEVDIIVIETPLVAYNIGAPSFDDYITYTMSCGFLPIGVDQIHVNDNMFMHLDIVFIKKEFREKYYVTKKFWKGVK